MGLPNKFFEPSFRHRRLGTFLSVIVGIMVFMATFVMAAEASLSIMTLAWNSGVDSRMTVEIPAVDDEAAVAQTDRVKQALSILHAMPNVGHVVLVPDNEAQKLLQPWINDADLLKTLPVPTLIDIDRKADSALTADDVRQQLKTTLRDVRVDDHASWMHDLQRFVHGIVALGGLLIVLSIVTLVLAVSLVCRAIMATEKETISLLHIMGADDADIAHHFQRHTQRLSVSSGLIGFVVALLSSGVLLYFLRHFANPAILQQAHWLMLAGSVLIVPVVAIWIASLSARLSVLGFLRAMP